MFKLQTNVSVVKMSQYSANQHSTQTTIKPIALKQNRINILEIRRVDLNIHGKKNVRSAIRAVKKKGAIYRKEP
jgi:hypothetical protein